MTVLPPKPIRANDDYRFRITRGPLGFWWWTWTGHGIANVQGGGGHLPRRSRQACEAAATAYAARKRDAEVNVQSSEFVA